MKILAKTAMIAVIAAAIGSTSAQAQSWTNATTGLTFANGTAVTVAGPLDISLFGWLGRKTCNVSIDGTVTASNRITFTASTPGFTSNCDSDNEGAVEFPFDVYAGFSASSPTGEIATAGPVNFNTPVGACGGTIVFNWYDAPASEGILPSNVTVSPCVMHAGSKLTVVGALAGNVNIN